LFFLFERAASMASHDAHRIHYLDGLRGVAILTVLLFHAYARWSSVVPFGDRFAKIALFQYGFLGVELFFLISGFVILMTLEKSDKFATFMLRRWLRLFPASVFVLLAIFFTAPLLPERPSGAPHAIDLLSGLLFIRPGWLSVLLQQKVGQVEGVYWSLYVEVIFYLVFGALYFILGEARALVAMTGAFLVAVAAKFAHAAPDKMVESLGVMYWGWFMVGALIYRWTQNPDGRLALAAAALGALCPFTLWNAPDPGAGTQILAVLVVSVFFLAAMSERAQAILSHRVLLVLGFVSYPLYLLHENLMVALIVKLGRAAPWIPDALLPVAPIAVVLVLAWLVAKYVEPAMRQILRPLYLLMCRVTGADPGKLGAAPARRDAAPRPWLADPPSEPSHS
jgi:peptidoglycan/LPS O-acetylase OafA/YrhL